MEVVKVKQTNWEFSEENYGDKKMGETLYQSNERIEGFLKKELDKEIEGLPNYKIVVKQCIGGNRTIVLDKKTMEGKLKAYISVFKKMQELEEKGLSKDLKDYYYIFNNMFIEIKKEDKELIIIDGQQRLTQFMSVALNVNFEAVITGDLKLTERIQKIFGNKSFDPKGSVSTDKNDLNFYVDTFNRIVINDNEEKESFTDFQFMLKIYNDILETIQSRISRKYLIDSLSTQIEKNEKKLTKEGKSFVAAENISYMDLFMFALDLEIKKYPESTYLLYLKESFSLINEMKKFYDIGFKDLFMCLSKLKIDINEKSKFETSGQCLTRVAKPGATMNASLDIVDSLGNKVSSNAEYFKTLDSSYQKLLGKIGTKEIKENILDGLIQVYSASFTSKKDFFISKSLSQSINISTVFEEYISKLNEEEAFEFGERMFEDLNLFIQLEKTLKGEYPLVKLANLFNDSNIRLSTNLLLELYKLSADSGLKEKAAFMYLPLIKSLLSLDSSLSINEEKELIKLVKIFNTFFTLEKTKINTLKGVQESFFNVSQTLLKDISLSDKIKELSLSKEFVSGGVFRKTFAQLHNAIQSMKSNEFSFNKKLIFSLFRTEEIGFNLRLGMDINSDILTNPNYAFSELNESQILKSEFTINKGKSLDKRIEIDHMLPEKGSRNGLVEDFYVRQSKSIVFLAPVKRGVNRKMGKMSFYKRKAYISNENNNSLKYYFHINNSIITNKNGRYSKKEIEKYSEIRYSEFEKNLAIALNDVLEGSGFSESELKFNNYFSIKK
jgi:hypothetical protein